jgi:hypothetical protein
MQWGGFTRALKLNGSNVISQEGSKNRFTFNECGHQPLRLLKTAHGEHLEASFCMQGIRYEYQ